MELLKINTHSTVFNLINLEVYWTYYYGLMLTLKPYTNHNTKIKWWFYIKYLHIRTQKMPIIRKKKIF